LLIEFALPITVLVASVLAFVNGVEALGERLGLTRFATGALLAAALTALPETIIALVSPFHGAEGAREVGLSSVIAAPSITLFLGAPVVGLLVREAEVQQRVSKVYLRFSLLMLPATIVAFLNVVGLYVLGALYLLAFFFVGRWILEEPGELMVAEASFLERLVGKRSTALVTVQTTSAALAMVWAADAFLDSVLLTNDPLVYGLLLSPFATCLEEVLVALVWTVRGKASMGLELLSGENVLQSSLVIGLGLIATGSSLPVGAIWLILLYSAVGGLYSLVLRFAANRLLLLGLLGYAVYIAVAVSLL
jgi:cation:H+ antiporter